MSSQQQQYIHQYVLKKSHLFTNSRDVRRRLTHTKSGRKKLYEEYIEEIASAAHAAYCSQLIRRAAFSYYNI